MRNYEYLWGRSKIEFLERDPSLLPLHRYVHFQADWLESKSQQ